jgi:hypothetical protein
MGNPQLTGAFIFPSTLKWLNKCTLSGFLIHNSCAFNCFYLVDVCDKETLFY